MVELAVALVGQQSAVVQRQDRPRPSKKYLVDLGSVDSTRLASDQPDTGTAEACKILREEVDEVDGWMEAVISS